MMRFHQFSDDIIMRQVQQHQRIFSPASITRSINTPGFPFEDLAPEMQSRVASFLGTSALAALNQASTQVSAHTCPELHARHCTQLRARMMNFRSGIARGDKIDFDFEKPIRFLKTGASKAEKVSVAIDIFKTLWAMMDEGFPRDRWDLRHERHRGFMLLVTMCVNHLPPGVENAGLRRALRMAFFAPLLGPGRPPIHITDCLQIFAMFDQHQAADLLHALMRTIALPAFENKADAMRTVCNQLLALPRNLCTRVVEQAMKICLQLPCGDQQLQVFTNLIRSLERPLGRKMTMVVKLPTRLAKALASSMKKIHDDLDSRRTTAREMQSLLDVCAGLAPRWQATLRQALAAQINFCRPGWGGAAQADSSKQHKLTLSRTAWRTTWRKARRTAARSQPARSRARESVGRRRKTGVSAPVPPAWFDVLPRLRYPVASQVCRGKLFPWQTDSSLRRFDRPPACPAGFSLRAQDQPEGCPHKYG